MRQYEIRWAELPSPIGRRPVLLLSRNAAYEYLDAVVVAEITTTIRWIPQELRLGSREGLPRTSVASLDNLHVIPKRHLRERVGRLGDDRVSEVKRALGWVLDWSELKSLQAGS